MCQTMFGLSMLIAVLAISATGAHPFSKRQSPIPINYCLKEPKIQKAYNLGTDFYLTIRSASILRYDISKREMDNQTTSFSQLFGDEFHSVDTVVSLEGFCKQTVLCTDSSWMRIENLVIVIGTRKVGFGYALYEQNGNERPLKLLNTDNLDVHMAEKIKQLGFQLQAPDATEDSISVFDGFWSKENPDFSYLAGVFVPSRGEILFNVFEDRHTPGPQKLLRKKFTSPQPMEWSSVGLNSLGVSFDDDFKGFRGMINVNDRVYAVDSNGEMYEIEWLPNDSLTIKKSAPMREFINCPKPTTMTTMPTTIPTTVSSTTPSTVLTSSEKHSTTQEAEHDVNKVTDVEVEIVNNPGEKEVNQSGELNEREEPDNRVDADDFPNQSDDPNSHSTPSSNSLPAHHIAGPGSDGLAWTVGIVVMILLLLAVFMIIPIIIIRNKANNKSHKIINSNGAPNTNATNKDEQVKLMGNSTNTDV